MKKKAQFITEIALGLILSGAIAWSYFSGTTFVETSSLKTYDLFTKFRPPTTKSNIIKLVEIDEDAVANIGRWPWPRSFVGDLIDGIIDAGADVIGVNIFYTEPDQNNGLEEIGRLHDAYSALLKNQNPILRRKRVNPAPFEDFVLEIENARVELDGDARLALSIDEAGNVVLPMYFQPGQGRGENLEPLPDFFEKETIQGPVPDQFNAPPTWAAITPVEVFGASATAVGHSNLIPDQDGTMRRIAPIMRYGDKMIPSFGLQLIREYKHLPRESLTVPSANEVDIQAFRIPVDQEGQTYLEFAGPAGTFDRFSALDILMGTLPADALSKKIVLLGVTAPGLAPSFVVPSGESFTGLELWATHMDNILNQNFIVRPPWARLAEWGMIALAALTIIFILPFIRAKFSIPFTALVFAGMIGVCFFLFVKQGLWISPAYGSVLLAVGFAVLVGRRLIFTEKGKEMVEAEGVETNKMLGLSFQGQGMLDLAFEKFRKCPMDAQMKDLLYNLGLDMERKRMFSKAAAVYEHIFAVDTAYKDVEEKIKLLKQAGQGAVFGGIGKKGSDSTVVVEGLGQFTTLGRYEVVKELGRGAMGIVYLGKDPKINRQVAIKTLRFEDDVDEEQAKSIKERFFREAESAGNLTHPNIIRIFDAGEDQDVAYIAMELIEGHDLKRYCDKKNLLPLKTVVDYVTEVAEALNYAHKQGVVHRDIKPPNIMLLKDGTLRITDFGIARIQAASKTSTGAVLGTPAYMSPEQINGNKVDGRADIFSLGIMLFELLTGEKPFAADSIAALLYRIANVDHPDPREFNPKVPASLLPILNKALAKDPKDRYQHASEMAAELRKVAAQLPDTPSAEPAKSIQPTVSAPAVSQPASPEPTTPPMTTAPSSAAPAAPPPAPSEHKESGEKKSDVPLEGSPFLNDLQEILSDPSASPESNEKEGTDKTVALNDTPPAEQTNPDINIPVDKSFEGTFQPPSSKPPSESQ